MHLTIEKGMQCSQRHSFTWRTFHPGTSRCVMFVRSYDGPTNVRPLCTETLMLYERFRLCSYSCWPGSGFGGLEGERGRKSRRSWS